MALITKPKTFVDNEKLLYTDLNSLMDTIYNEFNGSISNTNIASDAAIATTKISGTATTLNGVETLTNKTLTSPTVNTPTLILPDTSPTADGSIGFDRTGEDLQVGDGSNSQFVHMGAWTSFTPGITGAVSSIGDATVTCSYTKIGKLVVARYKIVFGSSTSFTAGSFAIGLPLTSATYTTGILGNATFIDATGSYYAGWSFYNNSTSMVLIIPTIATHTGTVYAYQTTCGNTVPFTWTTNDAIYTTITYEAA